MLQTFEIGRLPAGQWIPGWEQGLLPLTVEPPPRTYPVARPDNAKEPAPRTETARALSDKGLSLYNLDRSWVKLYPLFFLTCRAAEIAPWRGFRCPCRLRDGAGFNRMGLMRLRDQIEQMPEATLAVLEGVHFRPWEGCHFRQQRVRLLLLGESHHSTNDVASPTMTIDCTRDYIDGWKHKFWTNVMILVDGRPREIDKREFWSRVAFYNYIQEIVGDSSGIAPTVKMYQSSSLGLSSVIAFLRPTHVVVLAKRLWDQLPEKTCRSGFPSLQNNLGPLKGFFVGDEFVAIGTYVPHPSYPFNFNAKRLHPKMQSFLSLDPKSIDRQQVVAGIDNQASSSR
jgi:hypothetical protein